MEVIFYMNVAVWIFDNFNKLELEAAVGGNEAIGVDDISKV